MSGAFDELPADAAELLAAILRRREPRLFDSLSSSTEVDQADREAVETTVAGELMSQLSGPDWEPTEYGLRVERVIDAFVDRYPFRREREGP